MKNYETLIFGGAFNPPTKAHQAVVEACLAHNPGAELWLLPSGERLDKHILVSKTNRLQLLDLMRTEVGSDRIKICTIELDDPELTQTAKTVKHLRDTHPARHFRYIFGVDSYNSMPKWAHGQELQDELPMLLVPRNGIEPPATKNVQTLAAIPETDDISSTCVREALLEQADIGKFCCNAIVDYIHAHKLYVDSAVVA